MDENRKVYEPPKVTQYPFDDNELILTASGGPDGTETAADYAARALNTFMGGVNTTVEK